MKTAESIPAESGRIQPSVPRFSRQSCQVIAPFVFRRSVTIIEAIHLNAETEADALITTGLSKDKKGARVFLNGCWRVIERLDASEPLEGQRVKYMEETLAERLISCETRLEPLASTF